VADRRIVGLQPREAPPRLLRKASVWRLRLQHIHCTGGWSGLAFTAEDLREFFLIQIPACGEAAWIQWTVSLKTLTVDGHGHRTVVCYHLQ
jgi:hypothetical protein